MGKHTHARGNWPGTWLVNCDSCGLTYSSDKVKMRWDGLYVCEKDYEVDHPQKHLKVRGDKIAPDFVRDEGPIIYVAGTSCNLLNNPGVAGIGVAGCSVAGKPRIILPK